MAVTAATIASLAIRHYTGLDLGVGFGCTDANTLRVERRGENEIVFPNCSEFPSPLKRCTTR